MPKIALAVFGEINTPIEKLRELHDDALAVLKKQDYEVIDGGLAIDDPEYKTSDAIVEKLKGEDFESLIVCIAGWVPTHAVIRVTDHFRTVPMLLWGLCCWHENGHLVTSSMQAGTTALRPTFESLHYNFKFVWSVVDKPHPVEKIDAFVRAAHAKYMLRSSRVGSMGYRDMLLYGTQFEGNSMREKIGVEVETFEMLEMVQNVEKVKAEDIDEGVAFVKANWVFKNEINDEIEAVIRKAVTYTLALAIKIKERGLEAVTLLDVDGFKKLLDFPPAMVFVLLEHYCNVLTIPENDVMGLVTQVIMRYITGQNTPYLEYYEFFENSVILGVPDYIPESATDGKVTLELARFGLLNSSLLIVSKPKTGFATIARLSYLDGKYRMHVYTAETKLPPVWNEYGWSEPAPQLPSLEVFPVSCTVEEFGNKVTGQHAIVAYGDYTEAIKDFCRMMDIELI